MWRFLSVPSILASLFVVSAAGCGGNEPEVLEVDQKAEQEFVDDYAEHMKKASPPGTPKQK